MNEYSISTNEKKNDKHKVVLISDNVFYTNVRAASVGKCLHFIRADTFLPWKSIASFR